MSLFEKAESKADRLKMYVYGDAGTGKTITALHFPNPAVVDAESGSLHYGNKFNFHRLESSDPDTVNAAIDELIEDPGDFKTFVIDPMSVVYDQICRNKEERQKMKTGNMHYELQPLDYKTIKTEVNILMNKLLSLDMNIVVTARSKAKYAEGEFMKKIGQKPQGHKDLPYLFDVIIQLSIAEDGTRVATVEKDRTNKLPHEFEFSYDKLKEFIGIEALERDADQDKQREELSRRTGRNTKVQIDGDTVYTGGVEAETLKKLQKATEPYDQDDLRATLKEEYEVESILDLSDTAARGFLRAIQEHENLEEAEEKEA